MKSKRYMENEAEGRPTVKRYARFPKGVGKRALLSSALSVAIAFGAGCHSTGGFQAHLMAPAVQGGQGVESGDDGWYHPPESPGRGQG